MINIEILGARKTASVFQLLRRNHEQLAAATLDIAIEVWDKAREYVPVRTGRLRNSITILSVNPYHYQVAARTRYAAVVEFGRYRFKPFRGRYYMTRAVNDTIPRIPKILRERLRIWLTSITPYVILGGRVVV